MCECIKLYYKQRAQIPGRTCTDQYQVNYSDLQMKRERSGLLRTPFPKKENTGFLKKDVELLGISGMSVLICKKETKCVILISLSTFSAHRLLVRKWFPREKA